MAASEPSERRRIPIRLLDVPVEVRVRAARDLVRECKTQRERDDLMVAALTPSDQTFYVTDAEFDDAA